MNNLIETYNNIIKEEIIVDIDIDGIFHEYQKKRDDELYFYFILIYSDVNKYNIKKIITNDIFLLNGKSKFSEQLDEWDVIIDEDNIWTDEYAKHIARRTKKNNKYVSCVKYDSDYSYIGDLSYE